MTKYLISFPSRAMVVPDGEWQAVADAAHAVIRQAQDAGVYVFGGGIDEDVATVVVAATAASRPARKRAHADSTAVSPCSHCRRAKPRWSGHGKSRSPAVACRSCSSSSTTRCAERRGAVVDPGAVLLIRLRHPQAAGGRPWIPQAGEAKAGAWR